VISHDPYRALAAAIVWRAVQDTFCARKIPRGAPVCWGQWSCAECQKGAMAWLLSNDGLRMIDNAGLEAPRVKARLSEFVAAGLRLQSHRGTNPIWVTTR